MPLARPLSFPNGPAVMGILNVTPDSFSDGGRFVDLDAAVAHGLAMAGTGADMLDVGGESTRPRSQPVPLDEGSRRVVPVVEALAAQADVPISVDTSKAEVAAAALDAGATVVNDVSAGRDPGMLALVAERGAGLVLMHMQGTPATMQDDPRYDEVVSEVAEYLAGRVEAAVAAGVPRDRLWADPGIGFGKTAEHNWALLARLDEIVSRLAGVPVLVGTSRKGFLGGAGPHDREEATLATVVWAFDRGASMVRVHDVGPAVTAARMLRSMAGAA